MKLSRFTVRVREAPNVDVLVFNFFVLYETMILSGHFDIQCMTVARL